MTSSYKYTRNWENQQKAIFDGVGEYDIPVIEPEEYHHVDWIPFNKAKTNSKRHGVGIKFLHPRWDIVRADIQKNNS